MDSRLAFLRQPSEGKAPFNHTFEHRGDNAKGVAAMQYWPAKRGGDRPPRHVLLFSTGNPGLLDWYTPFAKLVADQLPESHAVIMMSHVGGDPRAPPPVTPLDLNQMVETKMEITEALLASLDAWHAESGDKNEAAPQLALMGHSMGAYMSVEVQKRVPRIRATYVLMPTLGWIANSHNGWKLWPLFLYPITPMLPLAAKLLKPFTPYLALHPTTKDFLDSTDTLRCVLNLAVSEMAVIRDPDMEWYHAQGQKPMGEGVYGLWSAGNLDGWVGKDGPLIQEALGKERYKALQGIPHAFCLKDEFSQVVADEISLWVKKHTKKTS